MRWRIEKGLLVAAPGRGGDGYLEIDVRRLDCDVPGSQRINVEVEVANFYPAIASRLGRFLYTNTQSRIHVIVTHGFLRRAGAPRARRVDHRALPRAGGAGHAGPPARAGSAVAAARRGRAASSRSWRAGCAGRSRCASA